MFVLQDFSERVREIEIFFNFLTRLEQHHDSLRVLDATNSAIQSEFIVESELLKTLKATCFLILYNLVESTITSAIQMIYDEFSQQSINFSDLHDELKEVVLAGFKSRKLDRSTISSINDIDVDIISISFKADELFSGNVDAKKIREIAEKYKFSSKTEDETHGGQDLLSVKTKRNTLAHGNESFSSIGKQSSTNELCSIKDRVVKYLQNILENVEEYLKDKKYLKYSVQQATTPTNHGGEA